MPIASARRWSVLPLRQKRLGINSSHCASCVRQPSSFGIMIKNFTILFALLVCSPAFAQSPIAPLNKCFADSTTGKDRKNLARWFFAAMTVHPEIRDLAGASPDVADQTSRTMAALVTRLLTENCLAEAKGVIRSEGQQGIGKGFEVLGQLAMMELLSNPDVVASISKFERYIDQEKMRSTLDAK